MSKYFIHIEPSYMQMKAIEGNINEYLQDFYQHRIVKDIADVYEKIVEEVRCQNLHSGGLMMGLSVIPYLDQHPARISIVWQATKKQAFHLVFYPVNEE